MLLAAKSLNVEAFRSFLKAAGAIFERPRPEAGEVIRFRIGEARGAVTQRKDGRLSLGSIARPLYQKFEIQNREERARQRAQQRNSHAQ